MIVAGLVPAGFALAGLALTTMALAGPAGAASLQVTDQLQRAVFDAADLNGDGVIDEAELAADAVAAFVGLNATGDNGRTIDELVGVTPEAFASVDANADGRIDLEELRLAKLAAFNAADRDQDGALTIDELLAEPIGAE
ncbi:MAG: EF-hand domain-containing protein [Geminicoccaceae bacterium]